MRDAAKWGDALALTRHGESATGARSVRGDGAGGAGKFVKPQPARLIFLMSRFIAFVGSLLSPVR